MDPLTYSQHAASSIPQFCSVLDADISKCDKRLYFWAQLEYCHELASVIEVEWASKRMLALVLFVLLTSVKVATPWGKFYGRHSRGGLSGAYIIQTLESWMTSLAVVRAALQSLQRSPSRCFLLRGFGVLADDVHIYAITSELHIFNGMFLHGLMHQGWEVMLVDTLRPGPLFQGIGSGRVDSDVRVTKDF